MSVREAVALHAAVRVQRPYLVCGTRPMYTHFCTGLVALAAVWLSANMT